MNSKRTIPAGLLDSGMASLATFAVGIYAIRVLDPVSLGAYALVFSGFVILTDASTRFAFLPFEVHAAARPMHQRLDVLGQSVPSGAALAVLGGLMVGGVFLVIPDEVPPHTAISLVVTIIPCTIISPVQDHVRRMLHIGGRSWGSAVVSAVHLASALAGIAALSEMSIPPATHPFGALSIANLLSCATGLLIYRAGRSSLRLQGVPSTRSRMKAGKWFVLATMGQKVGAFGVLLLVGNLAGAASLGYAEAARVLARPVGVLAEGIQAVLGPSLVRAGKRRDSARGKQVSRQYAVLVGAGGLIYTMLAGFGVAWNPLAAMIPNGYVIPGLTATTIIVVMADRVAGAGAALQLIGAGWERKLAIVGAVAGLGSLLVGATAPLTSAFAVPISLAVAGVIRRSWLKLLLRRLYSGRLE